MKVYYHGDPDRRFLRKLVLWARKSNWRAWCAVVVVLLIRIFIIAPAWTLVKIGDIGHRMAYAIGWESHDW